MTFAQTDDRGWTRFVQTHTPVEIRAAKAVLDRLAEGPATTEELERIIRATLGEAP